MAGPTAKVAGLAGLKVNGGRRGGGEEERESSEDLHVGYWYCEVGKIGMSSVVVVDVVVEAGADDGGII